MAGEQSDPFLRLLSASSKITVYRMDWQIGLPTEPEVLEV
jgi:hypothetical protein